MNSDSFLQGKSWKITELLRITTFRKKVHCMMKLPKELQEKLVAAETDVQACKILVENGVDPEEFEKTLPDSFLEQVNGGFVLDGIIVCCPICENSEPSEIAYERFASLFSDGKKFRCRRCDCSFMVYNNGMIKPC